MHYDPTERVSQSPDQQPYGQAPTTPAQQAPAQPYGQSNPGLPPYGQGTPSAPTYPAYQQPAPAVPIHPHTPQPSPGPYAAPLAAPMPGQLWPGRFPPGSVPPDQPRKKSKVLTIVIVTLIVVVVLAAGSGTALSLLTRHNTALYLPAQHNPVIEVASYYRVGSTPAGATGTTFQLFGTDFLGNSTLTILVDNTPVTHGPIVRSDRNGKVSATLTVTAAWAVGNHQIKAKDAVGNETSKGRPITIVTPGQANIPGPNGAPPDNTNMTITGAIHVRSTLIRLALTVKGADNGGTVCGKDDDGRQHRATGTLANGVGFTTTYVLTCSGTYKGGELTYTETNTSQQFVFTNGGTCTAVTPFSPERLKGTFTSATAISGTITQDAVTFICNAIGQRDLSNTSLGGRSSAPGDQGSWEGTAMVTQ